MVNLPREGTKTRLIASIALALVSLALVALWLSLRGSAPESARDFEDCVEALQAGLASNDKRGSSMTDCNARFAGRRKPDGGSSYYDFMQGRSFDIAGPN